MMSTRIVFPAILMALAVLGPGCSTMDVHVQVDPDAEFGSYGSFAFLPDGGGKKPSGPLPHRLRALKDPLFYAYLQEAIAADLTAKGLTALRERRRADLLIGYRTVMRDQTQVVPPVYGVGWRGRTYVARPAHIKWYKEGTLVIDVIDARSDHLIWRGVGSGAMRDLRPGSDLASAVRQVLAKFPPQ